MPDDTLQATLLRKASSIGPETYPRSQWSMDDMGPPPLRGIAGAALGGSKLMADYHDANRAYELFGGMYDPDKTPEAVMDLMKTKAARVALDASKDLYHKFTGDTVPAPGGIINWLYRKMPVSADAPRIVDNAKPPVVR